MTNHFSTPEHEIFRKTVRDFAEKELLPHKEEWETAKTFPKSVFKRAGDLGLLGVCFPEEVGGSGCDYWYKVIFCEEILRCRMAGVAMDLEVQADISTPVIQYLGSDEQKELFVKPAIKGDKIGALGVTEPGCGSDVANIKTTARVEGDDYVINGSKMYITNGGRADFITLAVRTGGEGHKAISLVTFPTDTKGFSVGKTLVKMGNHSSNTTLLFFENCRIPRRFILGEENKGFLYIMMNFQGERLVAAINAVAGCQLSLDDAIRYTTEREAFGKRIIDMQVWQHKFAELQTKIEAARQLTYHAVDLFTRGEDAVQAISMAKLFACDLAQEVGYDCLQAHGGAGYMEEYDISRFVRDIRLLTIGGGASEVMKEIIAKRMRLGKK
ncbi:MAG: acyl-CoA dehydrogenase family protein [Deltaproteobacteria bacterium]|nr:MAG: acyl-CoA dehydrogenase family protein [Deltaproteobacteria bacterium]